MAPLVAVPASNATDTTWRPTSCTIRYPCSSAANAQPAISAKTKSLIGETKRASKTPGADLSRTGQSHAC